MRLGLAVLAVNLFGLVLGSGLFGPKSGILELSASSFTDAVLYNGNVTAVLFYAPWCGHCQNLAPEWKQTAKSLRGLARVVAVDCDADKNKPLCAKYQIKGYPTIKVFQPAKLTDVDFKDVAEGQALKRRRPTMFSYTGAREAKAITSFVVSKLRNYAATLESDDSLRWLAPNQVPRVVMLPGKKYKAKSVSPLLKVLSREYFGKIRFAQVPRRVDGAWNLLGLAAPDESQLVYLSDDKTPVLYKGSMKKKDLKMFIDEQYALEMSRRQHLGQSETPSREHAADGLEYVSEDAQADEMEHVKERRKQVEEELRIAEEARREAFERHGKQAPERKSTTLAATTTEPVNTGSSSGSADGADQGTEAADFEYVAAAGDGDEEADPVNAEFEDASEDALLDEAVAELTPDQIVQEGPEAVASYLAAHAPVAAESQTAGAPAPQGTATRTPGLRRYDDFVERCLRTGYNCAILATTEKNLQSDVVVILRSLDRLSRDLKKNTVIDYMLLEEDSDLNEFVDTIGLTQRPGMIFWNAGRRRFSLFKDGWSQRDVVAFLQNGHNRKLELHGELPPKYLYWLTEEEVRREAEEAENASVKDEL